MCEWKMREGSVNRFGLIRKKSVQKSVKWVQNTVAAQRDDKIPIRKLIIQLTLMDLHPRSELAAHCKLL